MADIELNALGVKSDSIPDGWLITLVDPTSGAVAKNMTVAKFVELFTQKQPEATISKKGLKSHNDIMISNGSIESINPNNVDSNTIKFVTFSGSLSPTGRDVYGLLFTLVAENSRFRHQLFFNNGMEIFRRYYTAQTGTWTSWGQYSITASLSYSLEKNALTDTISLNNSILPPPRKLRARELYFRQLYYAIRGKSYKQPGYFNTS